MQLIGVKTRHGLPTFPSQSIKSFFNQLDIQFSPKPTRGGQRYKFVFPAHVVSTPFCFVSQV